ncbi:MAG TPA: PIN domain-containing protein [Tepidisphaeraceae bacterium]|nr:PIN domain-containing protein [Tepidisphaeraceae bacterium]
MLTDTGPLIALLDKRQHLHQACRRVFENADLPLITTWPCFTEAMYFAQREGGQRFQDILWRFVSDRILRIHHSQIPTHTDDAEEQFRDRMRELMEQYADLPMDLADASLVAVAEQLNLRQIFTLDRRDFIIYRTREGAAFEVVPD